LQYLLNLLSYFSGVAVFSVAVFIPYRSSRHFDLGVGVVFLAGGYSFLFASQLLSPAVAAAVSIVVAAFTGIAVLTLITQPLVRRNATPLGITLAALGVYIVGLNTFALLFGNDVRRPDALWLSKPIHLFQGVLSAAQLVLVLAVFVSLAVFTLVLRRTRLGRYFRAISDSPELARTLGVPASSTVLLLTVVSTALIGLAGALIAADIGVQPNSTFSYFIPAFAAVLSFGGRTLDQVVLGAAAIAITGDLAGYLLGQEWRELAIFALAALLLFARRFQGVPAR
jgi:branched-chain amino acid transport system permease protein